MKRPEKGIGPGGVRKREIKKKTRVNSRESKRGYTCNLHCEEVSLRLLMSRHLIGKTKKERRRRKALGKEKRNVKNEIGKTKTLQLMAFNVKIRAQQRHPSITNRKTNSSGGGENLKGEGG